MNIDNYVLIDKGQKVEYFIFLFFKLPLTLLAIVFLFHKVHNGYTAMELLIFNCSDDMSCFTQPRGEIDAYLQGILKNKPSHLIDMKN